jgi:hypothetical protein
MRAMIICILLALFFYFSFNVVKYEIKPVRDVKTQTIQQTPDYEEITIEEVEE